MLNFKNIFGTTKHKYCDATFWIRTEQNDKLDYLSKQLRLIRVASIYETKKHVVRYYLKLLPEQIWKDSDRTTAIVDLKNVDVRAVDDILSKFDFVVGYSRTV